MASDWIDELFVIWLGRETGDCPGFETPGLRPG